MGYAVVLRCPRLDKRIRAGRQIAKQKHAVSGGAVEPAIVLDGRGGAAIGKPAPCVRARLRIALFVDGA